MLHVVSTLVVMLIGAGLYFRHRRPDLHWRCMTGAFVADLALVAYIELTRQAVETVATGARPLLWFHAAVSLAVLVLYVVMIGLGRRLLAVPVGNSGSMIVRGARPRNLHRNLGIAFCVLRGLNYVTAFMV